LLIGGLDREEARKSFLPSRVRVVDLRQSPVGALDLVEGGATREPECSVGIGVEGHRESLPSGRVVRWVAGLVSL
jgi:hypothetical protein